MPSVTIEYRFCRGKVNWNQEVCNRKLVVQASDEDVRHLHKPAYWTKFVDEFWEDYDDRRPWWKKIFKRRPCETRLRAYVWGAYLTC